MIYLFTGSEETRTARDERDQRTDGRDGQESHGEDPRQPGEVSSLERGRARHPRARPRKVGIAAVTDYRDVCG
jgi:hypothetical protein